MKKFSIIVPTHNAHKYISHCLDSIVNLDYDKNLIEVIIVDDGSTDNTGSVIAEYVKNNNYMQYFEKPNGQWGSVINFVKHHRLVNNEIILILDSDDKLDSNALNLVNHQIKNADIFFGTYRKWNGVKNKTRIFPFYYLFKRSTSNKFKMLTPVVIPLVAFFKKELFYRTKDLDEGVSYQDSFLISQLVSFSKSIRWTTRTTGYYFYNRIDNSMSQGWTEKRFNAELLACGRCLLTNNPEFVSYKLNVRKFRKMCDASKKSFEIYRHFKFSWFPFYIRWAYVLLHLLVCKKYFRLNKNKV